MKKRIRYIINPKSGTITVAGYNIRKEPLNARSNMGVQLQATSFQPELTNEKYQPIKYGLTKPLEKETAMNILFHEWKSMGDDLRKKGLTWKQKWHYLFGRPGWSHDGSRFTSDQLRRMESEKNKNP